MSSESSNFSVNSSVSTPQVTPTPENSILDQIAQYASSLATQMTSWAQGVYAQTSQITGQAVQNFFDASQKMSGLASTMTDQYNNLFAPENQQLVEDANSYASPARMAVDMGMAGATQAQAGDNAIKNSEQNLLSFGIDPSAGRYAALDKAAAVQNAANVAGAENQQRMQDINTGQQLRAEAVQAGSLLPSSISNAENTAIQANAGASNASLANANTGANLMSLADKYLQTAMGLKLSPVGQNSRSSGSSSGQSSSDKGSGSGSGSGSGGSGGGGAPGGGSGAAWGMNNPNYGGPAGGGDWSQFSNNNNNGPGGEPGGGDFTDTGWGSIGQDGQGIFGIGDPSGLGQDMTDSNPFQNSDFGQTFGDPGNTFGDLGNNDFGGTTDQSGLGDFTYDPGANQSGGFDDSSFGGGTDSSGGGGGSDVWSQGSGTDYGSGGDDTTGGFGGGGGDFAQGGPVPSGGTTGGYVPPQASPSNGAQTDDVNAHLNAREFVVPQDVADWKGQEFFHKLIAQSRMNRTKMQAASPVGPRPSMPRGGQPAFSSQRVA